jgi:protein involved in sex pheromone biosynthesis
MKEYLRKNSSDHPSLYDAFQLGDRVTRIYQSKDGKKIKFKGIVLKIAKNSIEVYWDTKDGKYIPNDMNISFTDCNVEEIFRGDGNYTPIKKEKSYL